MKIPAQAATGTPSVTRNASNGAMKLVEKKAT